MKMKDVWFLMNNTLDFRLFRWRNLVDDWRYSRRIGHTRQSNEKRWKAKSKRCSYRQGLSFLSYSRKQMVVLITKACFGRVRTCDEEGRLARDKSNGSVCEKVINRWYTLNDVRHSDRWPLKWSAIHIYRHTPSHRLVCSLGTTREEVLEELACPSANPSCEFVV